MFLDTETFAGFQDAVDIRSDRGFGDVVLAHGRPLVVTCSAFPFMGSLEARAVLRSSSFVIRFNGQSIRFCQRSINFP